MARIPTQPRTTWRCRPAPRSGVRRGAVLTGAVGPSGGAGRPSRGTVALLQSPTMRIRLHEPAVALTDLAIGVEAGIFAVALARTRPGAGAPTWQGHVLRRWFVVFFAATGVAALAGAALHGLFPDRDAAGRRRLWRISLGSIGVAGLSAWCLGAALALPRRAARRVERTAGVVHGVYLAGLSRTTPPYSVAIATYLPGALALGAGLVVRLRDPLARRPAALALAGLGLTFGAAAVQLRRVAVHPRFFDHNATYHAIQAVAVACFFVAARGFVQATGRR